MTRSTQRLDGTTEIASEDHRTKGHRRAICVMGLCLVLAPASVQAQLIVEDTFTGYPDNALISADPAGPAFGLTGNWTLVPDSDLFVNKTQLDDEAGTGKAVYDRPSSDNGARTATRSTANQPILYEADGDLFYASFLIDPPRTDGDMIFELEIIGLSAGAVDFSFGISGGTYIVGYGGISAVANGGSVTAGEQLVVVRIEYGDTNSGGPDDDEIINLWVNPVNESSLPVIDDFSTALLNSGGGKVVTVSIRGDQMNGQPAFFDDLRLGLTFADVMPPTLVFADGFESGDTSTWSGTEPPAP